MGNGSSVGAPNSAEIQDLFEDTVFNELEIKRIATLNDENGTGAILATLLPMPILPHILIWLRGASCAVGRPGSLILYAFFTFFIGMIPYKFFTYFVALTSVNCLRHPLQSHTVVVLRLIPQAASMIQNLNFVICDPTSKCHFECKV